VDVAVRARPQPKKAEPKAGGEITTSGVDAPGLTAQSNGTGVHTHLVELIRVYLDRVEDETTLWSILDTVRKDA
jgi:hypothetical protein